MKTFCAILTAIFLSGCASQAPGTGQRVTIDALATGVGGTAAYFGGNKNPALTTAGAVGGFVVSEGFQAMAKSGRQKAYHSGIEEGKAMGQEQVLQGLWEESNGLIRPPLRNAQSPVLNLPSRIQNGVLYDAHSIPVAQTQPEEILIPRVSSSNAVSNAHYEAIDSGGSY